MNTFTTTTTTPITTTTTTTAPVTTTTTITAPTTTEKEKTKNWNIYEDMYLLEGLLKHGRQKTNLIKDYMETFGKQENRSEEQIKNRIANITKAQAMPYCGDYEVKKLKLPADTSIFNRQDVINKLAEFGAEEESTRAVFLYNKKMLNEYKNGNKPVTIDTNLTEEQISEEMKAR